MGDAPAQGLELLVTSMLTIVFGLSEWEMRPLRDWNQLWQQFWLEDLFVRMGDAPAQGLELPHSFILAP